MASKRYRIRNRLLEVIGEATEKELVARIAAGKFTGEEEVAAAPFDRWQKFASHPKFYDAFVQRLFKQEYHPPKGTQSIVSQSRSESAEEKGKTRQEVSQKEEQAEEPVSAKTHQHISPEAGHTIHQSEIDALFSEVKDEPESREKTRVQGKTDLILVDPPPSEMPLIPPERLEPLSALPKFGTDFDALARKKQQRKRWAIVGGVLVVLLILFRSSDPNPSLITDKPSKPDTGFASSSTPEERGKTLGEEAASLMAQDSQLFYQGAYDVLKEALAIDEKNPVLLGHLALAAVRLVHSKEQAEDRRDEIQSILRRARVSDPHSSELYRVEAILAQAADKLEDAKNFALKAAETDPVAADNLLLIGELHFGAGGFAEARNVLAEAVKADATRVRSRFYLALAAWEMGDVSGAHAEALEALKLNPLHPRTYLLLADIASRQNRIKEARGLYETCGRLAKFSTPDVPSRAFIRLGELYELAGNRADAQNAFQLAYYYSGGSNAAAKAKLKGVDTSDKTLKALAAQSEYQAGYFTEQGTGLLTQGKTEEALRFFQAAHLLAPKDGLALIQLGEVMEKTANSHEDFRRVMSYYQRAIDRDPTEAMGYIKLGLLESEQYYFDRAFKLLMQAQALAPESEKPYVALGKHYYKRQDYNEALNQFLRAAKINPSDSEILYYAGKLRLVYKKDGAREAQRFFNQAYTVDPRNYDALAEWLKLKVTGYDKNFAVKFVNNLIAAEPSNGMNYWVLGEVYAEAKEYRRAIGFYHKSLDIDNRQSKVRMSLAKALEAVGELDKAVAEFRLSSLLDRRNSEGFYRAADLLFQMKSYAQAEEVLKYLMNVTPNYPGVHRYLAKIHQLREQKDQAIENMLQEVANNPANYKFVLELAEMYIEYEKYDDAISQLKKITNLPPAGQAPEFKAEKIRAYLLLSRCYRAKSQPDSGEASIRLALALDPHDPELHRELGYVYYAMQRDKEGVREFEMYLERSPAARDAAVIKGLIKKMVIEE